MPNDLSLGAILQSLPQMADDPVIAVGMALREIVAGVLADHGAATDAGAGLGEYCIDTTIDGTPVRIVVSNPAG